MMVASSPGAASSKNISKKKPAAQAAKGNSILSKYFLLLLLLFGIVMAFVNHRLTLTVLDEEEGYDSEDLEDMPVKHSLSRHLKKYKKKHKEHHKNEHRAMKKLSWAKGKSASDKHSRKNQVEHVVEEPAEVEETLDEEAPDKEVPTENDSEQIDLDQEEIVEPENDAADNGEEAALGVSDEAIPDEDVEADQEEKVQVEPEVQNGVDSNDGVVIDGDMVPLAGLNCESYHALEQDHNEGGNEDLALTPSELKAAAEEMVYWKDIPQDARYVSPFKHPSRPQYLTFEPDMGGWNNIRMAMETVLAMAVAMGRTLVLPPHQRMYLLDKGPSKQRKAFSFSHFFHMESISNEHSGLEIIDMEAFLLREAMTGHLVNSKTKKVTFPPGNRTDWNEASGLEMRELKDWLRNTAQVMDWDPEHCMAVFPRSNNQEDSAEIDDLVKLVKEESKQFKDYNAYIGKPNSVDAAAEVRMKENWAGRDSLCVYDKPLQESRHVHFPVGGNARLLVHFYAFLFFQDWKDDLWMKRFVRDHVRYIDEIQCAAARVVAAVRRRAQERAKSVDPSYSGRGDFDTFHIRRGDFQYTVTRFDADVIYDVSKEKLTPNATVYIATDEKDRPFFKPLMKHYDVVFLDDFVHHLDGVNTNYYGMIDQLVASRGRVFFGCWFSTFTGYINRLRGYHADHHRTAGYEQGVVPSWYYALKDRYDHMQTFYPVKRSYYAREFPASWRLIDTGIDGADFDTRDHVAMAARRRM